MVLSTPTITGTTVVVGSTDADLEGTTVRDTNRQKVLGATFDVVDSRLVVGSDFSHISPDEL